MSKKLQLAYTLLIALSLVLTPLAGVSAQGAKIETSLDMFKERFATADLFAAAQAGGDEMIDINIIVEEGTDLSKLIDGPVVRKPYAGIQGITGSIKAKSLGSLFPFRKNIVVNRHVLWVEIAGSFWVLKFHIIL